MSSILFTGNILKLFLLAFLVVAFIPNIQSEKLIKIFFPHKSLRNLQYAQFSSSGIYYNLEFQKNDITGTGDKLVDNPYKTLCYIKKCTSGCCIGEINDLQCAKAEDCKIFFDSTKRGKIAAAVVVPIIVTSIFFISFFVYKKIKIDTKISLVMAFYSIFVITIPFMILYIYKSSNKNENNKEKNGKTNILIVNTKDVKEKDETKKIILSDNKKLDYERSLSNHANKEYNKLNSDENSNNINTNIVSITNKQDYSQKRLNNPEIIFDDNFKDDIIRHPLESNKNSDSYINKIKHDQENFIYYNEKEILEKNNLSKIDRVNSEKKEIKNDLSNHTIDADDNQDNYSPNNKTEKENLERNFMNDAKKEETPEDDFENNVDKYKKEGENIYKETIFEAGEYNEDEKNNDIKEQEDRKENIFQ